MRIRFSFGSGRQLCELCNHTIEHGDVAIHFSIGRRPTKLSHFDCWLGLCISALDKSKPQLTAPGRRPIALDDETRAARNKLLRRYSNLSIRIKKMLPRSGDPLVAARIERLRLLQRQTAMEIEPLGGVPSTWWQTVGYPNGSQVDSPTTLPGDRHA
jgi:hypothetical protein